MMLARAEAAAGGDLGAGQAPPKTAEPVPGLGFLLEVAGEDRRRR